LEEIKGEGKGGVKGDRIIGLWDYGIRDYGISKTESR
jgi:hypothetical protein